MPRFLILVFVTISMLFAGETPAPKAPAPQDPMAWSPPKARMPVRELVKGAEYEKAFAEVAERVDEERKKLAGKYPYGTVLRNVVPNSPAVGLGLQIGEQIIELKGEPVIDTPTFMLMRNFEAVPVTVFTPATGKSRTVQLPAGKIGVELQDVLSPLGEFRYRPLKDAAGSRQWDVAALTLYQNPALAETALFHALKSGLPEDGHLDLALGFIRMSAGEADAGLASLWFAMQAKVACSSRALLKAAASAYKLKLMLECWDREPRLGPDLRPSIEEYVKKWDALPAEKRRRLSPRELAAQRTHDPIPLRAKGSLHPDNVEYTSAMEEGLQYVTNDCAVGNFVETDHYQNLDFGVWVRSVVFKAEIRPSLIDTQQPQYVQNYTFNLFQQLDAEQNIKAFGFNFLVTGLLLQHPNPFLMQFRAGDGLSPKRDGARKRDVEIYVADDDVELILDGRRVMYAPLLSDQPLMPRITVSGAGSKALEIVLDEMMTDEEAVQRMKPSISEAFRNGFTRLHSIIAEGDAEQMQRLIKLGPNLNARNMFGMTPVDSALYFDHPELIRGLKDAGAAQTLVLAAALGDVAGLRKLLASDAKKELNSGAWTGVLAAVETGQTDALRLLLENGADPNRPVGPPGRPETPLTLAILLNHPAEAKVLIEKGADVNKAGARGSPLKVASDQNLQEIVALLKAKNAKDGAAPAGPAPAVKPPAPPTGDF